MRRDRREPRHRVRDLPRTVRRGRLGAARGAVPGARWRRHWTRAARPAARPQRCVRRHSADAGERMRPRRRGLGEPDVLVNNAGTARWRDLDDVPDEDWRAAWELNVMASHRAMRALVPGCASAAGGASSTSRAPQASDRQPRCRSTRSRKRRSSPSRACRQTAARQTACSSTRSARDRPSRSCGPARAGLPTSRPPSPGSRARRRRSRSQGRAPDRPHGRAGEIAGAIVFLCSDHASYVSGAAWSVDGGTVQVII